MRQRHGSLEGFAGAVWAAVPWMISVGEARVAIAKYERLWAVLPEKVEVA